MKRTCRCCRLLGLFCAIFLFASGGGLCAEGDGKKQASGSVNKSRMEEKSIFVPWSDGVFDQVEKEYGVEALSRFRHVYETARESQTKPVREKLDVANSTLNQLPWVSDREMWGQDDYWATPFEIIARAGGDCEDMAIAKYVMLRMMGVPARNLYLGYAKLKSRNEAHMVLVWANDQRTDVRVLDNFVAEVKSAKERMDLQVVYLNDVNGNIILIDDDGTKRKIKSTLGQRKIEKLENLKERILATREKYKIYNDGRPLFSNQN